MSTTFETYCRKTLFEAKHKQENLKDSRADWPTGVGRLVKLQSKGGKGRIIKMPQHELVVQLLGCLSHTEPGLCCSLPISSPFPSSALG